MSLRERKKAETRTAIADAAAQLFADRGFHAVTVGEVAEAAGVSKQTIFNHFPNKEELVFDRAAEVEEIIVAAVGDRAPGTTAVQAFQAMTRAFWGRVGDLQPGRPQAGFFAIVEHPRCRPTSASSGRGSSTASRRRSAPRPGRSPTTCGRATSPRASAASTSASATSSAGTSWPASSPPRS
jgi:AcrR family transcriptional regulator